MNTQPLPSLRTTKEVTEALRISRTTLYELIANGELPKPVKVGSRSLWPQSDIEVFVAKKLAERGTLH
ncbi:AlpA family phage regulatory protein [Thauera humireducens]|uniref:helix-turn-helix transcriptional regulator n=1 Tax=Thauera humireducens TaxID=1134435 RepID=UPI0024679FC4|nr:helix-turn-helix domain-containing protein [Thauera humireducens]CAH1745240.1 AlpA family phage regulatory protein [Thauera humireducens]